MFGSVVINILMSLLCLWEHSFYPSWLASSSLGLVSRVKRCIYLELSDLQANITPSWSAKHPLTIPRNDQSLSPTCNDIIERDETCYKCNDPEQRTTWSDELWPPYLGIAHCASICIVGHFVWLPTGQWERGHKGLSSADCLESYCSYTLPGVSCSSHVITA